MANSGTTIIASFSHRHRVRIVIALSTLILAVLITAGWLWVKRHEPLPTKTDRMAWLNGRYRGISWAAVWIKDGAGCLETTFCPIRRTDRGIRGQYLSVGDYARSKLSSRYSGVQYAAGSNAQFFNPLVALPVGCVGNGVPGMWFNSNEHPRRWAFGYDRSGHFLLLRLGSGNSSYRVRQNFPYGMTGVGCLGTDGRYRQVVEGEDIFSYRGNDWVNEARDGPDSGPGSRRARTILAWTVKSGTPAVIDQLFIIVAKETPRDAIRYHGWSWSDAQHFCFNRHGGLAGQSLIETIVTRTDEDAALKHQLATAGIHTALMLDGGGMSQLCYYKTDTHGAVLPGYPKTIKNGNGAAGVLSLLCAYARD